MTGEANGVKRASIRDVARLAGVSHQTVSRVLNGMPNVHASTRQRVADAIDALHFTPSRAARMLAGDRSYAIGILTTASGWYYGPSTAIGAVQKAARDAGYSTLLASTAGTSVDELRSALNHIAREGVDGIIVMTPQATAAQAARKLRRPLPVVMVQSDGGDPGLSLDNEIGGQMVGKYLLALGHRNVAVIDGPNDWSEARARTRGFCEVFGRSGAAAPTVVPGDWSAQSGFDAFARVSHTAASAVFCANDQVALGFIHAASRASVAVPEQISVVGFDDIPEAAHFLPPLTTVHQDFDALGQRAVSRLLAAMLAPPPASATDGTPPPSMTLVIRASTAPPRGVGFGAQDPAIDAQIPMADSGGNTAWT